jgi:hypothetical protein
MHVNHCNFVFNAFEFIDIMSREAPEAYQRSLQALLGCRP